MYKLILSDLDGTLLDDQGNIPQANIDYINKAISAGVQFALASGRSHLSLANYEKVLGINKKGVFGICFNGSVVYDAFTHEILRNERMELSLALEIIEKLRAFPVSIVVYDGDKLLTEEYVGELLVYADKSKISPTIIENFSNLQNNVNKVLIKGPYEILAQVEKTLTPIFQNQANCFFSSHELYEFLPLNANKGIGCKFLANHLNIPIENVIAVGDHMNDIEMIKSAGLGVAVGNGHEKLKEYADYITHTTNNDGVFKEIVQKFILV